MPKGARYPRDRFNPKRANISQAEAKMEIGCRAVIRNLAGGDITKIKMGMAMEVAERNGLDLQQLAQRLRQLGAKI